MDDLEQRIRQAIGIYAPSSRVAAVRELIREADEKARRECAVACASAQYSNVDRKDEAFLLGRVMAINECFDAILATIKEQPTAVRYGCHCDFRLLRHQKPDACVMDHGDFDDCVYALKLRREGKCKTDCEYWQPIKEPK